MCKPHSQAGTTPRLDPIRALVQFPMGLVVLANVESAKGLKSFSSVLSQPPLHRPGVGSGFCKPNTGLYSYFCQISFCYSRFTVLVCWKCFGSWLYPMICKFLPPSFLSKVQQTSQDQYKCKILCFFLSLANISWAPPTGPCAGCWSHQGKHPGISPGPRRAWESQVLRERRRSGEAAHELRSAWDAPRDCAV